MVSGQQIIETSKPISKNRSRTQRRLREEAKFEIKNITLPPDCSSFRSFSSFLSDSFFRIQKQTQRRGTFKNPLQEREANQEKRLQDRAHYYRSTMELLLLLFVPLGLVALRVRGTLEGTRRRCCLTPLFGDEKEDLYKRGRGGKGEARSSDNQLTLVVGLGTAARGSTNFTRPTSKYSVTVSRLHHSLTSYIKYPEHNRVPSVVARILKHPCLRQPSAKRICTSHEAFLITTLVAPVSHQVYLCEF